MLAGGRVTREPLTGAAVQPAAVAVTRLPAALGTGGGPGILRSDPRAVPHAGLAEARAPLLVASPEGADVADAVL